jgi:hypothetical protein
MCWQFQTYSAIESIASPHIAFHHCTELNSTTSRASIQHIRRRQKIKIIVHAKVSSWFDNNTSDFMKRDSCGTIDNAATLASHYLNRWHYEECSHIHRQVQWYIGCVVDLNDTISVMVILLFIGNVILKRLLGGSSLARGHSCAHAPSTLTWVLTWMYLPLDTCLQMTKGIDTSHINCTDLHVCLSTMILMLLFRNF